MRMVHVSIPNEMKRAIKCSSVKCCLMIGTVVLETDEELSSVLEERSGWGGVFEEVISRKQGE